MALASEHLSASVQYLGNGSNQGILFKVSVRRKKQRKCGCMPCTMWGRINYKEHVQIQKPLQKYIRHYKAEQSRRQER